MKRILKCLLVLLVLFTIGACGQNSNSSTKNNSADSQLLEEIRGVTVPQFKISINDKTVNNEDMAEYPIYKALIKSINSAGTESSSTYIGFKFVDALKSISFNEEVKSVEAVADDGYSVKYEGKDIEKMIIAISKDGSQFKKNPWFCPCDSNVTGDYLQGLVTIIVNDKVAKETNNDKADESQNKTLNKPDKQDKTDKVKFANFSIKINNVEHANSDFEGLKIYKITCDALNSKDAVITSTYTGYVLKDVFKKFNINNNSKVTIKASDGYNAELTKEQIDSEYTLIAIEKDKETGKDGTFWLAPCEEDKTKKYIGSVVEINAE